jgi:hypothetical protein
MAKENFFRSLQQIQPLHATIMENSLTTKQKTPQ